MVLKVHPSNYRVDGFVEDTPVAELATLGPPVVVDLGSGLLDATCPWWPGRTRRRGWPASRPPCRRSPPAPPSSRSAATSCSAGRRPGSSPGAADLVERCGRHPLARALRPGGLVLAALQDVALAYLRRDVVTAIPFWRMAAVAGRRAGRAGRTPSPRATGAEAVATEALPGAGSAPGATIPSCGVRVAGDHLAALRADDPPIIARARDGVTVLDLRAVEPADDAVIVAALRRAGLTPMRVDRHRRSRRPRQVDARPPLTGTDPDRFEEEQRRGLTIDLGFAHCVCRRARRSASSTCPATCGSCATCSPASAASTPACSSSPPPRAGSRRARSTCASSSSSASPTASSRSPRSTCSTTPSSSSWRRLEVAEHVAGTFLAGAPIVPVGGDDRRTGSTSCGVALAGLARRTPASADRGRPRLWIDRVFAAKGSGTVVTGTLTGGSVAAGDHVTVEPGGRPARVRAIQTLGRAVDAHRARATGSP